MTRSQSCDAERGGTGDESDGELAGEPSGEAPAATGGSQKKITEYVEVDDDGRYDCREMLRNMEFENLESGETADFRCGMWDCYCCAHRMRHNFIEELERLVHQRPALRRFLTLTLDPETAPDETAEQHEYLTERFNALRTSLNDRYDDLSYVWVREEGESDNPHLHLIVDRYLPQDELSHLSERAGLGRVVNIKRVEARSMAKYLTKYLTKGSMANLPKGARRYGSSADIDLSVRGGGGEGDWSLMMDDLTVTGPDGEPLRRAVEPGDFVQQKKWGGPVPPD